MTYSMWQASTGCSSTWTPNAGSATACARLRSGLRSPLRASRQRRCSIRPVASIPPSYRTPRGLSDDLRSLLAQASTASLGTINPDGSPQMTVVQFSLGESDRVFIPTNQTTRKVSNVIDRPDVTALVDLGFGWISCTGQARIVHGAEAADLNRGVYERLLTEEGLATIGRFLEAHEDCTIEITPTKWLSWQSDVMVGWFEEHGIDPGDPARWMRDLTER